MTSPPGRFRPPRQPTKPDGVSTETTGSHGHPHPNPPVDPPVEPPFRQAVLAEARRCPCQLPPTLPNATACRRGFLAGRCCFVAGRNREAVAKNPRDLSILRVVNAHRFHHGYGHQTGFDPVPHSQDFTASAQGQDHPTRHGTAAGKFRPRQATAQGSAGATGESQ